MTDAQRVDAFFERLKKDPDLGMIAIMLAPHRAMMDPAALVVMFDGLAAHWAATALAPLESET